MAHSHLLVQQLLKQLEHHQRDRKNRSHRPDWLGAFVHQAAALFEPMTGVGRVGSTCEFVDDEWQARLYLGATETVGGKHDGHAELVSFQLNMLQLSQLFTRLDQFDWNVAASKDSGNSSFITLRGEVDQYPLCVKVYSRPPKDAGPAFRQHPDGSLDVVTP